MNTAQRKNIIVFALIIILAFLIGYNGIYKRNLRRLDYISSQIEDEEKKNEILGIIGSLDKRLQAHQKRSFFPSEITQLLDRISEGAKKTGIEIKALNPLPALRGEQYIELSLKLSISCGYHKLGRLLAMIENEQEFIWVKELIMQKPTVTKPQAEEITPKIDLTISEFYLKK